MTLALVLISIFATLVWLGRRARKGRADWRLGAALMAALAFGGAAFAGFRGEVVLAAVLAGVGFLFIADVRDRGVRANQAPGAEPNEGPSPRPWPRREAGGMTDVQARAILGVSRTAAPSEIKDAYRRLMRSVHPDQGGSPALAAQINAARDQLLGKD